MAFGRFERSAGEPPMSDINVTPLVDVMLVLLVIFIITAPLMMGRLKLDLPKTEGTQAGAAPQVVRLAIDAQGQIYLDEHAIGQDALAHALSERARQLAGDAAPELQLRADAHVPYGRVAELMGLAEQAGLNRIAFVTERKAGPAASGLGAAAKP